MEELYAFVDGRAVTNNLSDLARIRKSEFDGYRKVSLQNPTHTKIYVVNDSGDLRGVAGGDGELGCLCGKAGTSHLCDGSAHSSGCVVNGYGCLLSY